MSKTATKKKTYKATATSKRRTKGQIFTEISTATELKRKQVVSVFDVLSSLIAADLGKKGCGEFNFLGFIKLKTVNKPAQPARKGRNPFTGQEIMLKAKPASRKVRARALRSLNNLLA
ncbi:MAG: DNA-binding protein [Phycisphaerales bacterium]|nr:DNA-binding protein [Phycisphaerales bacterium]